MALVTTKELFADAQQRGYAVCAFNVENMEMAQAVVAAAEELSSPVIMQTTSTTLKYAEPAVYQSMIAALAAKANVPVAMHLDHGSSYELAVKCLRAGYTSIMIDGSHSVLEENIAITKEVVKAAHAAGVPVEAELGKVGGKEDDLDGGDGGYTDPADAVRFVAETGIDSLAVAIGTAHGVYKGVPKLDKERLAQIHEVVSIPLVLHGTSGVPDEDVRDCIARGICKVNYATDLRIAFTAGVNEVLQAAPDTIDPKKYCAAGREKVKAYAMDKMRVCMSDGKAR